MSRLSKVKKQKSPNHIRIILYFIRILAGLSALLILGFYFWTLTWKTYRNDEFGFSFKYPKSWYVIESYDDKGQNETRNVGFYIDSKKELPNTPTDPVRSPGNVQISITQNSLLMEAHKNHTFKKVLYKSWIFCDLKSLFSLSIALRDKSLLR